MARRKAKVGPGQKLVGYGILATLGVITVWLLIQQFYFNPAVLVASRSGQVQGRSQAASGPASTATAGLIPEVSGFSPLGPVASYGPENLSDKINGKAELYLSAGFKEMSCRSFILSEIGKAYVEVFVYDMGSPQNAYAVFSSQRRPGSSSLPLAANAYTTGNALFFCQGKFYVEIVCDRASAELQKALETYAAALLAQMPSEGRTPDLAQVFPREGLVPGSVRLSATDTFGMAKFDNVFTGEYTFKDEYATAFLAQRDTPEQAQKEAQQYREFLLAHGYKQMPTTSAAEDLEVLGLDNSSFEIILVQGRTLAGVHEASSPETAVKLAERLMTALKGKP